MNKIAVLCAWIYEKVMRPNTLAFPRTILQKLVLLNVILNSYRYFAAQSTDMQYIILFLNISNRDIKRRFRSIDTVVGNFARCQENYWCMHAPLDSLHLQQVVYWLGFHPHHAVTASSLIACEQFQTSVWKRRQWWEFGNKIIIFHHPSLGFSPRGDFRCCNLTCHQTGIWLWERLLWK